MKLRQIARRHANSMWRLPATRHFKHVGDWAYQDQRGNWVMFLHSDPAVDLLAPGVA